MKKKHLSAFKAQIRTAALHLFYFMRRKLPNFTQYCVHKINERLRLGNALRTFLGRGTISVPSSKKEISLYQSIKRDAQRAARNFTALVTRKQPLWQLSQSRNRDAIPPTAPLSPRASQIYRKLLSELKEKHSVEKKHHSFNKD